MQRDATAGELVDQRPGSGHDRGRHLRLLFGRVDIPPELLAFLAYEAQVLSRGNRVLVATAAPSSRRRKARRSRAGENDVGGKAWLGVDAE